VQGACAAKLDKGREGDFSLMWFTPDGRRYGRYRKQALIVVGRAILVGELSARFTCRSRTWTRESVLRTGPIGHVNITRLRIFHARALSVNIPDILCGMPDEPQRWARVKQVLNLAPARTFLRDLPAATPERWIGTDPYIAAIVQL
jgi:hypothetical protein